MSNRVIHISDSEAANNFLSLLEQVRAGVEVVIEHDARPVAVLLAPSSVESVDKIFSSIAEGVPEADWARVPADLAKNLDHYLYGSSKVSG